MAVADFPDNIGSEIRINRDDEWVWVLARRSADLHQCTPETAIAIGEKLIELGRAVIAQREEATNDAAE